MEVGKDIETHGDKKGEEIMTVTLPLTKGIGPCAGGTRKDKGIRDTEIPERGQNRNSCTRIWREGYLIIATLLFKSSVSP